MKRCVARSAAIAAGVVGMSVIAASASGAVINPGVYLMANHPDGNARPPNYGMRLDELYDAVPNNHDVFTFDFEHAGSFMTLEYTGSTIHISGVTFGGRDTGSGYANDAYLGFYQVDMLYTIGVGPIGGDDDVVVDAPTTSNTGSISTPLGHTIPLWDLRMGDYSLRLGDENDDQGHRGFNGASGWGWLNHGVQNHHVADSDFIFTLAGPVPTPGSAALLVLGGITLVRRRTR